MNIKLFIFDWSGVISDDRMPVYEAAMNILKEYGKPTMTFEEWLPKTTMTAIEFLENHGIKGDPAELFALYKKKYNQAIESGIIPIMYHDAKETLDHLVRKGKDIAVLSSHPAENLIKEAEDYGLAGYMSLIIGESKDKAAGLKYVIGQMNCNPKSALYTGDTVFDIRAAKSAGICSAGIFTGYHDREMLSLELPDHKIENLSALMSL